MKHRRKKKWGAGLAALALAATGAVAAGLSWNTPEAEALTAPVAMTADDLPTHQTNGVVWALAQSGGQVFAGGTFSAVRPPGAAAGTSESPAVNFVALDAATGAPTSCKLSFTIGSGVATVRALAVSPDGSTLYAGGNFGTVNGVSRSRVAAIDIPTCTVKAGFNAGTVSAMVRGIGVSPDGGTVYLAGDFLTVNGQSRQRFAAVSPTGALTSWTANADQRGKAVETTPDGQHVVLGGDFNNVNGKATRAFSVVTAASGSVVRQMPAGSGGTAMASTSTVQNLYVDSSGIYTANEGTGGGVFDGRMALNLDAGFTVRWKDTCLGATQDVTVYKSVLYSVSHAHNCSSESQFPELNERQHLLAESTGSDRPLLSWFPDTDDGPSGTEQIGPRAIVAATGGGQDYMWVAGEFTRIASNGNRLQQGLVRMPAGPDTRSPVAVPDTFAGSNVTGGVKLTWRSSWDRDDSRLTYRVYRNGTQLAATAQGDSKFWTRPTVTFNDTTTEAGTTYNYQVAACDAANNCTARSATVTVTTPGTPTQTTLEATASADTYVNAGAPTTLYGTHQQLAVRGTSAYLGYLRFTVPAAPSGMVLKSAKLTVRTSSTSSAGSADSFSVVPVTGSWAEATTNYANRPALSATVLGTFTGPATTETDKTVTLNSGITPGSTANLAITSTGTDALWLWSRETSFDPKLTLTFGKP
ncbi:DNRLRE domain-containing protein [Streptomyces polyrhachis]|uniref:DNRLRE domain-containing protein n=1 Tax=Streptomyces polyrhachis TaxID=1282885 RepID=A0ABW2GH53_9ACTN